MEKSVDYQRLPQKKLRKKSQPFGSNDNIAAEANVQNDVGPDTANISSEDEEFVLGTLTHFSSESESESTEQSEYETASSESTVIHSVKKFKRPSFDNRWMLKTEIKSNFYIPQVSDKLLPAS